MCSDFARCTDVKWRDEFYTKLYTIALSIPIKELRLEGLYALVRGMAACSDSEWVTIRNKQIFSIIENLLSNTSPFWVVSALSHVKGKRWKEAQYAVQEITQTEQRDKTLRYITERVLLTERLDRARIAIYCIGSLSELRERQEQLYELGSHPALIADPVAFGLLVERLNDNPDKLQSIVTYMIEQRPDFV